MNQFAKACRSVRWKSVHAVSGTEALFKEDKHDELCIDSVSQKPEQAFVEAFVEIKFKPDTDAQVNVIPAHKCSSLKVECALRNTPHCLTGYGGQQLNVKGT